MTDEEALRIRQWQLETQYDHRELAAEHVKVLQEKEAAEARVKVLEHGIVYIVFESVPECPVVIRGVFASRKEADVCRRAVESDHDGDVFWKVQIVEVPFGSQRTVLVFSEYIEAS